MAILRDGKVFRAERSGPMNMYTKYYIDDVEVTKDEFAIGLHIDELFFGTSVVEVITHSPENPKSN